MLKHLIEVNKGGTLFFNFDFQLVGASLSLLPKFGNRDRKRYKKSHLRKDISIKWAFSNAYFCYILYKNTLKSYKSQTIQTLAKLINCPIEF